MKQKKTVEQLQDASVGSHVYYPYFPHYQPFDMVRKSPTGNHLSYKWDLQRNTLPKCLQYDSNKVIVLDIET